MNRLLRLLVAMAAVLSAALVVGAQSALADGPDGSGTSLKLDGSAVSSSPGRYVLTATLVSSSGKPIGEQEVSFYQTVDLLGTRSAFLGTATTDSTGVAALAYVATQTGGQSFVARFAGAKGLAKSEATAQVQIIQSKQVFEQPAAPFGLVGQWLPYVLGALVLGVWVLLAGLLLSTIAGIRSAARPRDTGARRVLNPLAPQPGEVGGGT